MVRFTQGACIGPQPLESEIHDFPSAALYVELGNWFGDHNQYPCAIEAFRAGLQIVPDSGELSYLLGLALNSTGHPKDAIAPLQQSIQVMPKAIEPRLLLGAAFERLQQEDKARIEFESALAIDPHSNAALHGLARILIAQGNYGGAIKLLRSVPRDEILTLDLAQVYGRTRMFNEQAQFLLSALRENPRSSRLANALIMAYVNQARNQEAIKLAEKSLKLWPNNAKTQDLYLHVLVLNHDLDKARPFATILLAARPHDFEVVYLDGILEREAGQYSLARQQLEEAITLNPTHFDAHYNLGIVLSELKDFTGARQQLEKSLALGAGINEPQVRYRLGSVLRTLGETKQARQQFKLTEEELQASANKPLTRQIQGC